MNVDGLTLRPLADGRLSDIGIHNSGFEEPITVVQSGFGWQLTPSVANVTMSVDTNEHQSGSRSLRIDFRGNSSLSGLCGWIRLRLEPGDRRSLQNRER